VRLEALGVGEAADGAGYLPLEAVGRGDVCDLVAVGAEQVVVVLGQVLGELEPGVLVAGGDPPDQPGGLQIGQVPVGRAAGQAGQLLGDIADADRMPRVDQ
jgi:hypothetical protein